MDENARASQALSAMGPPGFVDMTRGDGVEPRRWVEEAPPQLLELSRRTLACRVFGADDPLILLPRFRGGMDDWDPAFLNELAKTFRVIPFDQSGCGRSTGEASYDPKRTVRDAIDLADALDLPQFTVCGWDVGADAAEVMTALYPERVRRTILIGGRPPGVVEHGCSRVFAERILKPVWDLDDVTTMFFDPSSRSSRAAASASHGRLAHVRDASPPIAEDLYRSLVGLSGYPSQFSDDGGYRDYLSTTGIPILAISGSRDIACPLENWFEPSLRWRSLHLRAFPEAGHGVQHQYPEMVAECIRAFNC